MTFFINDKPLFLSKLKNTKLKKKHFDIVIENNVELTSKMLQGNVLIRNASTYQIYIICRLTEVKKLNKLKSITLTVEDMKASKAFLKDQFKIIKAAGGVVMKDDKMLMMLRLGKWDLPKGKLEKGEEAQAGAIREVEEECGIKVSLVDKLPSTWHSYNLKGKRIMKKTYWYLMHCDDDSKMTPQLEENIQELRWMDKKEVKQALKESYNSIQHLLAKSEMI